MGDSEETIIEEKNKQGTTVNKYIKGRYLGKVISMLLREDLQNATSSLTLPLAENLQPK